MLNNSRKNLKTLSHYATRLAASCNFVAAQVTSEIARCDMPCNQTTEKSTVNALPKVVGFLRVLRFPPTGYLPRDIFVVRSIARSRIRFYFSQRLLQRIFQALHSVTFL